MRICFRICCMLSNSIFEYAFECCEYAFEYAEQYTLRICGLSFLCQPFWPGRQFANLRSFLTKSFVCEFAFLFGQAVCSRVPAPPSPGRLTFSLWTRSVFPNWMPSAIFLWAGIVFPVPDFVKISLLSRIVFQFRISSKFSLWTEIVVPSPHFVKIVFLDRI